MKYKEDRPLAKLDAAVSKLLAIANGMEPDHAGRLQVGAINEQFLGAGGNVHEYMAAVRAAIDHGYVTVATRRAPTRRSSRQARTSSRRVELISIPKPSRSSMRSWNE